MAQKQSTRRLTLADKSHVIVDSEDFDRASEFVWRWRHAGGYSYVVTNAKKAPLKVLSRFIKNAPGGAYLFHFDGDKTNFRKANLGHIRPQVCVCDCHPKELAA
jgi:hypothetical protein